MNEYMGLTGHDWCVETQKAEAGNTWLEPNQIKINIFSSELFVSLGNLINCNLRLKKRKKKKDY